MILPIDMGQIKQAVLNGKTIYIEVADRAFSAGPATVGAGRPGEEALKLSSELQDAIVGSFGALTQSFKAIEENQRPCKVTVEYGLKLSADAKFYIINSSGEATIKITAEWEPQQRE